MGNTPAFDLPRLNLFFSESGVPFQGRDAQLRHPRNSAREFNPLEDIRAVDLTEAACITDAHNKILVLRQHIAERVRQTRTQVTVAAFDTAYSHFRGQFLQSNFADDGHFLYWFYGKDLLGRWLAKLKFGVTVREYCEWAVNHLDFNQYPDLLEFRRICWHEPLE